MQKKRGGCCWKIQFLAFAVLAPKLSKPSCSGNTIVMNTLLNMEESIEISVKNFTCCKQASNQTALTKYSQPCLRTSSFKIQARESKLLRKKSHKKLN